MQERYRFNGREEKVKGHGIKMKIATLLFTYNRSYHTEQVLFALKENTVLPQKLIVFQDGRKRETDINEWNKVNSLIHKIDWCDHEIVVSGHNKGLADAIVSGVDYAFQEYDAIIVLEDDCVPHREFMAFMIECLHKYQEEDKVYNVSGYAYPVDVEDNGTDAYFTRRISSWGWGTWKDRWAYFDRDYRIWSRLMNNPEQAEQLRVWGADLQNYLRGNICGKCNSWGVFWSLNVIERGGYCLSCYRALISNIGFDGSGEHSGVRKNIIESCEKEKHNFRLPDKIELPPDCEQAFADLFAWTPPEERKELYIDFLLKWVKYATNSQFKLADRLLEKGIKKCSIWGKGKLCALLLEELQGKVDVLSVIESFPAEEDYQGVPVVGLNEIPEESQLIIVIPMHDFQKIVRMAGQVTKCELISLDKILEL